MRWRVQAVRLISPNWFPVRWLWILGSCTSVCIGVTPSLFPPPAPLPSPSKAGSTWRVLWYIFPELLPPHLCRLHPEWWSWRPPLLRPLNGPLRMCGSDRLPLCSEQQNRRLTWAHSAAPYSHRIGTHFMKTNNNVTRTQNTSFTAALPITFLFFCSLHWQPEGLILWPQIIQRCFKAARPRIIVCLNSHQQPRRIQTPNRREEQLMGSSEASGA